MKLNISDWKSFCASDIFFLYNGSGITKEEIEDNPGSFPAVQSGADNNGCIGYISKDYCKAMNYTYAHKFIPFIEFLGVPCLILTDLDSVADRISKGGKVVKKSVVVSQGETTSNETIKWWIRRNKGLPENDTSKIDLTVITSMSPDDKTRGKCHIEFQTAENGLCGHSLEEAVRNVNRKHYDLGDNTSEEDLEFKGKSKTDFALDLICENAYRLNTARYKM